MNRRLGLILVLHYSSFIAVIALLLHWWLTCGTFHSTHSCSEMGCCAIMTSIIWSSKISFNGISIWQNLEHAPLGLYHCRHGVIEFLQNQVVNKIPKWKCLTIEWASQLQHPRLLLQLFNYMFSVNNWQPERWTSNLLLCLGVVTICTLGTKKWWDWVQLTYSQSMRKTNWVQLRSLVHFIGDS